MENYLKFLGKSGVDYKQHQYDGVQWCMDKELACSGGFVADEMGLGKTIMMIGLMITNFLPNTLIVLPNVLIDQWVHEIWRTTKHVPLVFYGPAKKGVTLEQLRRAPIVITSYSTIRVSRTMCLLHDMKWNRVLFDEAHHLRNKNRRHFGAKRLNSPIKWLISGTPMQNRLADLYNLCSVLDLDLKMVKDANNFVKSVMLCRSKADANVVLPALSANSLTIEWLSEEERITAERVHESVYQSENAFQRLMLIMKARQACITTFTTFRKGGAKSVDTSGDTSEVQVGGTSGGTSVVQVGGTSGGTSEDTSVVQVGGTSGGTSVGTSGVQVGGTSEDTSEDTSGEQVSEKMIIKIRVPKRKHLQKMVHSKMHAVVSTLTSRNGNGNGKLVFCHFREEIDTLVKLLSKQGIKNVATFDGRTGMQQRSAKLAAGFEILIMQIQTGCEGLNLQNMFNEVYFVSPNWNPAMEDQAVARCHRIGQKKEVFVFRFYMNSVNVEPKHDSFDQKILLMQNKKRELYKNHL